MADDRIIQKIEKLIALSESSSIEEARTSAHMACKLILKHKLKVGQEVIAGATNAAAFRYERTYSAATADWFINQDLQERFRRATREAAEQAARRARENREQGSPLRKIVITAKFQSHCIDCGRIILVGELCRWDKETRRVSCHPCCPS